MMQVHVEPSISQDDLDLQRGHILTEYQQVQVKFKKNWWLYFKNLLGLLNLIVFPLLAATY